MYSIQFMNRLVLSALSLNGLIIPLICGGNEAAHLVQQKLDLLWSKLQLALEREREATQAAAEATQMAEIAQDRIAKTIERERKFRASYVQAKEIAMRALKQERKCKIALILSWLFYLFWLCYFHVLAQVRMLE